MQYRTAVEALADPRGTRLLLVARAQRSTLREVARTHEELATIGLSQQYLVVNGVLPASETTGDPLAAAIYARQQAALAEMPDVFRSMPRTQVPLQPFNIVGIEALKKLLGDTPTAMGLDAVVATAPLDAPALSSLIDGIAKDGHGLAMSMGKGGVGKTTVAAAIAVELAHRGFPVHLTTSDPAAHMADALDETLPNLTVSRIDPHDVTEQYRQHVLETKGAALDAQGRALLEKDLRSPCTEEIAVFQAFSRIIREAGKKFVVRTRRRRDTRCCFSTRPALIIATSRGTWPGQACGSRRR